MHAQALRIDGPNAAAFDERRFRHALGRFATGVVVISTGSGERLHAMTPNASCRTHSCVAPCSGAGPALAASHD